MTAASSSAGTLGRMMPPAVVTMPLTSTRSLTATRRPGGPTSSEREMKALSSMPTIVGFESRATALSLPADVEPVRRFHQRQPLVEQGRRAHLVAAHDRRDPGPRGPAAGDDQRP